MRTVFVLENQYEQNPIMKTSAKKLTVSTPSWTQLNDSDCQYVSLSIFKQCIHEARTVSKIKFICYDRYVTKLKKLSIWHASIKNTVMRSQP